MGYISIRKSKSLHTYWPEKSTVIIKTLIPDWYEGGYKVGLQQVPAGLISPSQRKDNTYVPLIPLK